MRSAFATRDNISACSVEEVKTTVRPRPVLPKSLSRDSNEDGVILGESTADFVRLPKCPGNMTHLGAIDK